MQTEILSVGDYSVEKAAYILEKGGVVAIPTETVYGLAADGTNPDAVKEIFKVKGRPSDNPLIAHVHKDYDLNRLVKIEITQIQCKAAVKVHGVFSSHCGESASSPILQFHRAHSRDSAQIVTPFVQVGTYPTRNFATLGPL